MPIVVPLPVIIGIACGASLLFVLSVFKRNVSQERRIRILLDQLAVRELGGLPRKIPKSLWSHLLLAVSLGRPSIVKLWFHASERTGLQQMSEACKGIALSLLRIQPRRPQIILVTSPAAHEGKSTFCANVSLELSKLGMQILLVDGDLRQPSLHARFGVSNAVGVSDLLEQRPRFSLAESIVKVFDDENGHLYLLPSGPGVASITGCLSRMSGMIASTRRSFDMVVIDSPPMRLSDARLLAGFSDGVILVTRCTQTDVRSVAIAHGELLRDGIPVLGAVLNESQDISFAPDYSITHYYRYYADRYD